MRKSEDLKPRLSRFARLMAPRMRTPSRPVGFWLLLMLTTPVVGELVPTSKQPARMTKEDPPEGWSEYEITRARNIQRNNAKLRALGLISAAEEEASNAVALGSSRPSAGTSTRSTCPPSKDTDDDDDEQSRCTSSRGKRRRKKGESVSSSPNRKSLRLKGLAPDDGECTQKRMAPVENEATTSTSISRQHKEERRKWREECREARQRAALEHAALGAARAARENPTATYDHCLMRVRSMSDPQLRNRVKTIERAAGKHCVIKMAIMASCLRDEGLWELAALASGALERLKALRPPPEEY